ncbi:hypothetical protein L3X38_041334 [Prunus dulcis]|uniref:Reverse transcriptase Ty1/copia-type domain-containing protein n=1 Tax=Prunus dulcis TaxID=3755 RepID=A0AAD4UU64_PRUDU|nr:hypothetical protein L3X38_041334 [Prunus dulcis]
MNEEMRALQKNDTWELVPLPHGKKIKGCRWIYTVKLKAERSIERNKAILVAKGYTQRYGIDYQDTFAPTAKIKTIRVLLSLAANLNWPLHQFDVKNTFLHGDFEEEVYMDLSPGCNLAHDKENQVCNLRKSLYGLKQSPRAWFGYIQSNVDHTLFLKHDGRRLTALIIYVDDIVVTGNNTGEQLKQQKYLTQVFEMKDLGYLKYFLGIEVAGYFTFVRGNLVTWRSKKQNVVSRSNTEVEYRGMAHRVCELLWIKRLLTELVFKPKNPMELHCDNKSAISVAHNPVQHDRTKHVEVDRHFIKEKIEKKIIRLPFIRLEINWQIS